MTRRISRTALRPGLLVPFLATAIAVGCSPTTASYAPLNSAPRAMAPRQPEEVELFSSGAPARPHVDVALLTVEQGDIGERTPTELVGRLRRLAAERGCDGLVLGPPGSKSETNVLTDRTDSYRVYSGTCIVYGEPREH